MIYRRWLFVAFVAATTLGSSLGAQDESRMELSRGPRFLSATKGGFVPIDIAQVPALTRQISLSLDGVPVKQALAAITAASGVLFAYKDEILPAAKRVRIEAQTITVAAALTDVLLGARIDVVLGTDGRAALVPRVRMQPLNSPPQQLGTIVGRVTERMGAPISSAQVTVVGTGLARYTDDKGQYRIANVPAGEYDITVRRLGFEVTSHKVKVLEGETVTADFAMARVATSLTEVVTTATGERSRLEVGNNVGTIKADSLVPTTLIRSMSDLLAARVPGVIVGRTFGLVGAPSLVRIRGVASLSLSNDPIIVLDGIRLTPASYAGLGTSIGNGNVPIPVNDGANINSRGTTRLDDIDPNTIESIDILRGPSASSLYGTDAAAGVIVIKTKKGVAGSYRFNVLADDETSHILGTFPSLWMAYGHQPNGTPLTTCYLAFDPNFNTADHTCIQDSIRTFNTFNDPRLTSFGQGTARNLSTNLSGGTEQLREFLSLRLSDAVGVGKLSAAEQDRVARMWGEAPPSWVLHPNTEQNVTGATRTNLQVARGFDLLLTATGVYRNTLGGTPNGGIGGPLIAPSGSLARAYYDTLVYLPAEDQRSKLATIVKRGYATVGGSYTPLSWLVLHGTIGGDFTLKTNDALVRAADCTAVLNPNGCSSGHVNERDETFVTTIDLGAQATWAPRDWLSFRTSTGEQISRTTLYFLLGRNSGGTTNLAFGTDLLSPSPVSTTAGAQLFAISENRDASATAGWYLEETISWRERLFLTGAFRQDVASAFGKNTNASAPIFPKYSLSWVVSDEPFFPKSSWVSSFRVRTAYGHSGQEALQTAVLNNYTTATVFLDGAVQPAIGLDAVGNANLRPERTTEVEGGFDLSLLDNERFHVEATVYRKLSHDAITTATEPPSLGGRAALGVLGYGQSVNLGQVENRGWELATTAKLLDGRMVAWDLTVNASRNANRLVSSAITNLPAPGNRGNFTGYPLESFFGHVITGYADFNGDGVLEPNEVQYGTQLKWLGSVNPSSEWTYGNMVRLWSGLIQINAIFDQVNGQASLGTSMIGTGFGLTNPAWYLPLSLAKQAAVMQYLNGGNGLFGSVNTVRFSELSVTGTLPPRFATRVFRARTASVTLAGRNLALWTSSADKDPDMNGGFTGYSASQSSPAGIPQPRNLTIRINLGY